MIAADGFLYEYDSRGNLLFMFGAMDSSAGRLGVFRQPSSIEVGADGTLYVADAESGLIHLLVPTEFAEKVHLGLAYFEEGLYVQSEDYWRDVVNANTSFALAHTAIGQSHFKQMEYDQALTSFYLANDTEGYSQAFWELRHEWLQENMAALLFIILVLGVISLAVKVSNRKWGYLDGLKQIIKKGNRIKLLRELLLARKIFRHPIDTFYDIKRMKKASVKSATILYGLFIGSFFFTLYAPGFIFAVPIVERVGLLLLMGLFFGGVTLFIVLSYLISTINEGEGSLKEVYMGTVYSVTPFILFAPLVTLMSRFLTYNESFLYDVSMQFIIVWSLMILFVMIKEIHNFTMTETIKNLLLTLFGGILTVIVIFILAILLDQVREFIYAVIQEVLIRV